MQFEKRRTVKQFIKYISVGLLNTIIGLSVIFFCMKILHFTYIISNILGYFVGLINSFIWNKIWTFGSKGNTGIETAKFLLVFSISYTIQLGALIIIKEIMHIIPEIAQILSVGVYTITSFILNKFFTFRK